MRLADQIYRCLRCGCRFKGVQMEVFVMGHMTEPTCPKCYYWAQRDA